jgi:hypothetical protein
MADGLVSVKLLTRKSIKDSEVINSYLAPNWLVWENGNGSVELIANIRYVMSYARKRGIKIKACPLNMLKKTTNRSSGSTIIVGFDAELNKVVLLFNVEQLERDHPPLWEKISQPRSDRCVLDEDMLRQVQVELGLNVWSDNNQVKRVCEQLLRQDGLSRIETKLLINLYWRDEQTFRHFSLTPLDEQSLWIKSGRAEISVDVSLPSVRERYCRVVRYLKQLAVRDHFTIISPEAIGA